VGRIGLKEARVDMVLAADAFNAQQMLLLAEGTRLTAQNLRMLKSWGVDHIHVHWPNDDDDVGFRRSANHIDLEQETLARYRDGSPPPAVAEICRVAAEIVHARRHPKE
jgi:hypothetical protein